MVGVALNVNDCPAQDGFAPDVIAIDAAGITLVFIIIVIEFEVTVGGVTFEALEVITQLTICPLIKVFVV